MISAAACDTIYVMSVVTSNKSILGGTPVFAGTRVPVAALFDHLEAGKTVDYFLSQFPSVTRDQVHEVLESSKQFAQRACAVVAGK